MNNQILLKTLQLDSLISLLSWYERAVIHLYMSGKTDTVTMKIEKAYQWIEIRNWEPPLMKYGQDCLQYFYDSDADLWLPVENYLKVYYEYKNHLTTLKN